MDQNCPPLTLYSFENVVVTVDNRQVVGFWEGDDAVQVTRPDDIGTRTTGADGASVVSITASEVAEVTLRLMPNSAMNSYLEQAVKAMRAGSQRVLQIAVRDSTSGEGGGCSSAIITKEPDKQFGATSGSREWVLFCNCWQSNDIRYTPVG